MAYLFAANGESTDGLTGGFSLTTSHTRSGYFRASYTLDTSTALMTAFFEASARVVTRFWIRQNGAADMTGRQNMFFAYDTTTGDTDKTRIAAIVADVGAGMGLKFMTVNNGTPTDLFTTSEFMTMPTGTGALPDQVLTIDINYLAVGGWVRVFSNDVLVGEFHGDVTGGTSTTELDGVGWSPWRTAGSWWESRVGGILIADDSLLGTDLVTITPNAAGDYNTWDGTYTAIDEAGTPGSDFISSDTAGEEYVFNYSTSALMDGVVIRGLYVGAWALRGETGPDEFTQRLRIDSVDYDAPDGHVLTTGYAHVMDFFATNPDTLDTWTKADIDALQIGGISGVS